MHTETDNPSTHLDEPSTLRQCSTESVSPEIVERWIRDDTVILIDVREPYEYENDRIPGSFLVSMSCLNLTNFPKNQGLKTVLISEYDGRALAVADLLTKHGFEQIYVLAGGLTTWRTAGLEIEE